MPGPFNHCHMHCQPAAIQQAEDEHARHETVTYALILNVLTMCAPLSAGLCVLEWWAIDHIL